MPQAVEEEPAASTHHHDHADAMADGVECEDLMPEVNRTTTSANMRWKLVDRDTGQVTPRTGGALLPADQVKIRLFNEMASDPPCTIRSTSTASASSC